MVETIRFRFPQPIADEPRLKTLRYWEIIADNLSEAGWSWGCVATLDSRGRTMFVADAHRESVQLVRQILVRECRAETEI
jgi:hypothetical protein